MYLIITENSYDALDVNYCDTKAELIRNLQAKDYFGRHEWPVSDIEVFAVGEPLTIEELNTLKSGEQA